MNIEEFYDQDERRRHSQEIELGTEWDDPNEPGVPYQIAWVQDTGEVYAKREPVAPPGVLTDPFGDVFVTPGGVKPKAMTVEILGHIPTRQQVEAAFEGWQEAMKTPGSLGWARERATGAAPTAGKGHTPSTEGERTLPGDTG